MKNFKNMKILLKQSLMTKQMKNSLPYNKKNVINLSSESEIDIEIYPKQEMTSNLDDIESCRSEIRDDYRNYIGHKIKMRLSAKFKK